MPWAEWQAKFQKHPRWAFELDLAVAVTGFIAVFGGGIGINAGFLPKPSMSTVPTLLAATVVAIVGAIIMALALVLTILNVIV